MVGSFSADEAEETQKPLFTSLRAPFQISLPCNCRAWRRLRRRLFFRDAILRPAIAACRGRQGLCGGRPGSAGRGNTREAAIRPNKMALHSAEFPFLIPALAVPSQNCFQMSVSIVQFGQKFPVLPLLGNMESRLEPKPEVNQGHLGRARGRMRAFRSDDRVLLGLVAASLV